MIQRKKTEVDVIKDILLDCLKAFPDSNFVNSLYYQYLERGGLSKKQLEGLQKIAVNVKDLPTSKLATLEAEILKRPNRFKSKLPPITPLYSKNEAAAKMIEEILLKYPQHKRVLFLKNKSDNNEPLSPPDISELEKFHKILLKKN